MRVNIMEGYMSLDNFKELLNTTTNIKDVYLLCHQAGCPVYVIRNIEDNCSIFWHPYVDKIRNTLNIEVVDGVLEIYFESEVYPFISIDNLRKDMISNHMLGDNPFDANYCIWKK